MALDPDDPDDREPEPTPPHPPGPASVPEQSVPEQSVPEQGPDRPSHPSPRRPPLKHPLHHHETEAIDTALATSHRGLRVLVVSFAILAGVAAVELVITALSGSVALLGDTIHNAADTLTALPLATAFWLGRKPPTRRYTYGYGRAEDLAGVSVVLVVAVSTLYAAVTSIHHLIHPVAVHHVVLVIVAALVGLLGNEVVARYRIRVGRAIGSAALIADGHHARSDSLTSVAVVLGAIGTEIGVPRADAVMGLVVSLVLLNVLRVTARDIFRRLMDCVDPELVDAVEAVLTQVAGVDRVNWVRIRWIGHALFAEATIVSDATLPLADAHAIAEVAHHRLLHEVPRLTSATIHQEPGPTSPDRSGEHPPGGRPCQ